MFKVIISVLRDDTGKYKASSSLLFLSDSVLGVWGILLST